MTDVVPLDEKRAASKPRKQHVFQLRGRSVLVALAAVIAKQEGYTPYRRKTHQSVNHTAKRCRLPSEKIGDEIETEKTYETPVQTADNGENKGDSIYYHITCSP